MDNLDAIYTKEWFDHDFTGLEGEFDLAAAGIHRMRGARRARVLDVGCGPGLLLAGLRRRGWHVTGVDGASYALAMADRVAPGVGVYHYDLTTESIEHLGAHDVVVCTEVAEHLPEEFAARLVGQLAHATGDHLVFTAAPPGQDGHHHVNCKPKGYWLDLFAAHAMIEDEELTAELRRRWGRLERLSHMTRNLMVLR